MILSLGDYKKRGEKAVGFFWESREAAERRQQESGVVDQGERASVTAGKNMDGFRALMEDIIRKNGLADAEIYQKKAMVTLPGYFRPTKLWDLVVMNNGVLVAAIELKSHVGPSFGNNFNNRSEEAIGSACDFWTAFREGAFGVDQPRPFLGWFILVEDAPGSRSSISVTSPHFPVFKEFEDISYLDRYHQLCKRMLLEGLYTAAAVIASSKEKRKSGVFSELSNLTGLRQFITVLAAHSAAEASRSGV
ncbi:MAG: PaeR7I family type II restriction endonuclease [Aminivibrio sp.]